MRDLLHDPLWQACDLGKPIPDSLHAVSVALPLWEHVIGYEEEDSAVINAMNCGYPRFFCHPLVTKLFDEAQHRFARSGQKCLVFPSIKIARQCVRYLLRKTAKRAWVNEFGFDGLYAVTFNESFLDTAKEFWRYCGQIVSSRLAEAALKNQVVIPEPTVKNELRTRIAQLSNQSADDVYLFGSGMAAIYTVHQMLQAVQGPVKTVQIEFPYVDALRVQQEFGPGVHFFPIFNSEHYTELEKLLKHESIAGIYCEMPSNPLMRSVDLARLSELASRYDVPLVVDDTVGTCVNLDVGRFADLTTTSLTKYFSGVGDVIAGSLVLSSKSKFYTRFSEYLKKDYEDLFWVTDALSLEANSRDFPQRIQRVNKTAQTVVDYLGRHPRIEKVFYSTLDTGDAYRVALRSDGGGGGLMSILLKDAADTAPLFYDALRVSKGPSLGTNYTLACPYMLLAHYQELDWAEQCGASRYLIRLSIGLEDPDDLIERLEQAFNVLVK